MSGNIRHVLKTFLNTNVSVGSASTLILEENNARGYAAIVNDSNETIYLAIGGDEAVMNKGIRLNANGGTFEVTPDMTMWKKIRGICASGSKNVTILDAQ